MSDSGNDWYVWGIANANNPDTLFIRVTQRNLLIDGIDENDKKLKKNLSAYELMPRSGKYSLAVARIVADHMEKVAKLLGHKVNRKDLSENI